MKRLIPRFILSNHGIQDGEELSHTGNQGDLFWLAGLHETLIKSTHDRVETYRKERSHIERASHGGPPAENRSLTAHRAGVTIEWHHAYQRPDLPAGQLSQFWNLRNQSRNRGIAYSLDASQQGSQVGVMLGNMFGNFGFGFTQFFLQSFDDCHNAFSRRTVCRTQPVSLCNQHAHNLPTARDNRLNPLQIGRRQKFDDLIPVWMPRQNLGP